MLRGALPLMVGVQFGAVLDGSAHLWRWVERSRAGREWFAVAEVQIRTATGIETERPCGAAFADDGAALGAAHQLGGALFGGAYLIVDPGLMVDASLRAEGADLIGQGNGACAHGSSGCVAAVRIALRVFSIDDVLTNVNT